MSPAFPSGKTTGSETTSFPYGVMVWHSCFLARNCADLSNVGGKPSFLKVFSKFAMPDLLTKDSLPNDINSKHLSSELFNLFFGGMVELIATDQGGLGQLAAMEPMASHTQCERKCTTTMMSLWHRTLIRCEHNGMHRQSHMGCSHAVLGRIVCSQGGHGVLGVLAYDERATQ
jgi:hypothetical protein